MLDRNGRRSKADDANGRARVGSACVDWVRNRAIGAPQIVRRSDHVVGFVVLPRRWVVERTFAWLGRYRRMSEDYEELTQSSECMMRILIRP